MFPSTYTSTYPIQKTPGPWLVLGVLTRAGQPIALDIHLNSDDPSFPFEDPVDWPELDPTIIEDYNAPHRQHHRLLFARMTEWTPHLETLISRAHRAEAYLALIRAVRTAPHLPHSTTIGRWTVGRSPK